MRAPNRDAPHGPRLGDSAKPLDNGGNENIRGRMRYSMRTGGHELRGADQKVKQKNTCGGGRETNLIDTQERVQIVTGRNVYLVNLSMIWCTPCGSSTTFVPSHFALFVNSAQSSLMSTSCADAQRRAQ